MNQVRAILGKEWTLYWDTPMAYVVAVAFLLTAGFLFSNRLFFMGVADLRPFLSWLPLLLMFYMPALAMRSLAEERRSGTFEVLATLPVTSWQIVLGKFAAVWLQATIVLLLTLEYPLSLLLLADLDLGQLGAAYLAVGLLAAVDAAVGVFASAMTRNTVIAYVLGFFILFAMFLIGQADWPLEIQDRIMEFNPVMHYQLMLRGVVALDDVMCLLSTTAIFLALAWYRLEKRRWA